MSKQEQIPDWLHELERTSWQIELLVSGGLIYTLYSLPDFINSSLLKAYINTDFEASTLIVFLAAFIVAKALLIGFGVNLFLRAIWLALLGVHFSYPKGIDYERLNYSSIFEEEMEKRPSTLQRIMWLERWSSLSFSIAIMLTVGAFGSVLMVAGFYYFIFEPILPDTYLESELFGYAILVVVSLFSFGFVDRIFFRRFRNNRTNTRRYFRFSQFLRTINLTRVLERESLTVLSNNKRWKIHLINLGYFVIAIVVSLGDITLGNDVELKLSLLDSRAYKEYPAYHFGLNNDEYDDLLTADGFVREASIPSEVIRSNSLPVFITYDQVYDRSFDHLADSLGLVNKWSDIKSMDDFNRNTEGVQAGLNDIFLLRINGEYRDSLRWFYRTHAITQQEGFYTRLDISELANNELHELVVSYLPIYRSRTDTTNMRWIPFWKE